MEDGAGESPAQVMIKDKPQRLRGTQGHVARHSRLGALLRCAVSSSRATSEPHVGSRLKHSNMRRMNKFAAFHLCHSFALSFRRNDANPLMLILLRRQPRMGLAWQLAAPLMLILLSHCSDPGCSRAPAAASGRRGTAASSVLLSEKRQVLKCVSKGCRPSKNARFDTFDGSGRALHSHIPQSI